MLRANLLQKPPFILRWSLLRDRAFPRLGGESGTRRHGWDVRPKGRPEETGGKQFRRHRAVSVTTEDVQVETCDVIAIRPGVGSVRIVGQVKAYHAGHMVDAEQVKAVWATATWNKRRTRW
jgi:hypothetical protein